MFTAGMGLAGVLNLDSTMVAGTLSEDVGGLITVADALAPSTQEQVGS